MATITLRTADDGAKSYQVKVRLKGHPAQPATFRRLTDARKWAQATEAAIREGRHFKTTEAKRHTLGELVDRYAREVLPGKKDGDHQGRQLDWWKGQIGAYALADVTPSPDRRDPGQARGATDPQGTGNRPGNRGPVSRRLVSRLHHRREGMGLGRVQPVQKVTKPREPRGRVRFLDA